MKRRHEIDMTSGPLLRKIVTFILPLIASGILQLLFNAADVIVVGKFAGASALAAVGSTASLITLFINLFIGIATGANVLVSRYYGSRNQQQLTNCIHCSMGLSVILGILVCLLGLLFSEPMLRLMQTAPEVLDQASLYLRIYFIGMPATMVYNFGAAILRAIGDTNRPLRFLSIAGIVNVILNLILVIVFHMDVAGVAIATVISQYVSAILVVRCLVKSDSVYKLCIRDIRLYKDMVVRLLQVGLPAGLNSTVFSIANVLIQSSINSFGYITMAANSAATNIDGFVYISINSVYHAALSFTSQNYGARNYARIKKIIFTCIAVVVFIGTVIGILVYILGPQLLSLYVSSTDPDQSAIIATGMIRLLYIALPYALCGVMEVFNGSLRGLGKSWSPMIISALGACAFRIVWIYTIFASYRSLPILYLSYPITWIITPLCQGILLYFTIKKLCRSYY